MNLPPAVLVIIAAVAVANLLILLAVMIRARAERSQQFVEADALMSSSYRDEAESEESTEPAGRWIAAGERLPTARHRWQDAADDWPAPAWPAAARFASVRRSEADATAEPFQFPEPTALEQRSHQTDDEADDVSDEVDDLVDDADEAEIEEAEIDEAEIDEADEVEVVDEAAVNEQDEDDEQDDDEVVEDLDDEAEDDVQASDDQEMAVAELEPMTEDDDATDETEASAVAATIPVADARGGRDELTGLLDARAFEEVMSHEDAREQRYGRPATVIVFELDGLTKLVERLGPEPGDRIETALGETIKRLARRADHIARLERGRYAALLPETDEVAAINYVERVRRACDLWLEAGAIAMRLAIGWASTSGDAGLSGAIRVATDRMRAELRRNARSVGDVVPGADAIDVDEPPQLAAAG
jgi:diguanylate cyclase (GGDEF)-like protein